MKFLTASKTVFSQQAFELRAKLCVCLRVYVLHLEGSVDFYEGVEGGQVKLSDLPPVTRLDGTLYILPGNKSENMHNNVPSFELMFGDLKVWGWFLKRTKSETH